jgi:hypothetical protein
VRSLCFPCRLLDQGLIPTRLYIDLMPCHKVMTREGIIGVTVSLCTAKDHAFLYHYVSYMYHCAFVCSCFWFLLVILGYVTVSSYNVGKKIELSSGLLKITEVILLQMSNKLYRIIQNEVNSFNKLYK